MIRLGVTMLLLSCLLWVPGLAQSQGPPPPGPSANAVEHIEYFWMGVSGLTHATGWHHRNGVLVSNVLGPESVLLTPTLTPLSIHCPSGTNTAALDLNEGGSIVGFCTARDGVIVGFFRSPPGRYTELRVPRATRTEAVAVNARDHVGGDYRGQDGIIRAFIWTGSTRYTTIEIPGAPWTALTGLNIHGDATGFTVAADGTESGWLRRGTTLTPVSVPGAVATVPVSVNDAREITGVYATTTGEVRSFVRTARGYEDVSVPDKAITDVAGMRDGVYWGRYLIPGDAEEMPWLSYGFIARLVPQPLPPPPPAAPIAAFRSAMAAGAPARTLALCERTGGLGTITPGKLLGRQGGCP